MPYRTIRFIAALLAVTFAAACRTSTPQQLVSGDAASKVYVAPGHYDEFYAFLSGGYSGNVSVYGLPSGRMLKIIPVFSQFPENGYGYTQETRAMLQTDRKSTRLNSSHFQVSRMPSSA